MRTTRKKPSTLFVGLLFNVLLCYSRQHQHQPFVAAQSDGFWDENSNKNTDNNFFGRDDTSPEAAKHILLDLYSATDGLDWNDSSNWVEHNTSNKGKILLYNTTITPYRYETHRILSRPIFVSSFTLITCFWWIFTPFGTFRWFLQRELFDVPLFSLQFSAYVFFSRWCFVLYSTYVFFQVKTMFMQ